MLLFKNFLVKFPYTFPFNPVTNLKFTIPTSRHENITLFDIMGREFASIVSQNLTLGCYTADFDASKLSSGVQFYKLTSGSFTDTKKKMLIK